MGILQGFVYIVLATIALCNFVAFAVTKTHCFLYIGFAFALSLGAYLGFHRTKMRNKFNIKVNILLSYIIYLFHNNFVFVMSLIHILPGNETLFDFIGQIC